MANEDLYLLDLEEGKRHLNVTTTTDDAEILAFIGGATFAIEAYVGNAIVQRSFTEDYTAGQGPRIGGASRIHLKHYPIVSVTSITDDESNTVASTDYIILADEGYLEHDWRWPAPVGRWTIVYTAGRYATTKAVEQHWKTACKLLLADYWNLPKSNIESKKIGDLDIKYRTQSGDSTSSMPMAVERLIKPFRSLSL
jgi:hypothetical protein